MLMTEYKLTHLPGFQQGDETVEYELGELDCFRVVTDESQRRPVGVRSVCSNRAEVEKLASRLNQIDWAEVKAGVEEIFVEDVNLNLLEGPFGKISVPLSYAAESEESLTAKFREQCVLLVEVFDELKRLTFDESFG